MGHTIEIKSQALETARPFASPVFASALLECSHYVLLNYVDSGRLPLAFDIGFPGARRLCLRIATASVMAVRARLTPSSDVEKLFGNAFPKALPLYGPSRLAWLLQCDADHIYHLVAAGALSDAGGATRYLIPRDSITKFLAQRQLNFAARGRARERSDHEPVSGTCT